MKRKAWALDNNKLTLFCHVHPGAKQDKITGLYDNCLKIQLKTPPVDGRANKALIAFLAKTLGLPKPSISIKRGLSNRRKTIVIEYIKEIPALISNIEQE